MKTVIFAGPSISAAELRTTTSADIALPIRRGDLARFADYEVFVIIDGEFGQSLAVSPKEILKLLDGKKIVIGASSMGALRASELDVCGMVGVGWVYERFAAATVRRDDDVALVYSPLDLMPITIPMVDIEYWMSVLEGQGIVLFREKTRILRSARRVFFAERTESRLIRELKQVIGPDRLETLLACTDGVIPNIKHLDAQAAVEFANRLNVQIATTSN